MAAHALPEEMFEIVVLSTTGDRIVDRPLSEIGGKGLFTLELEQQLISGELDFAVHSSKDMPTILPDGLHISAYLPREDIRDAVIGRTAPTLTALPDGAVVGTASLRRQALIRRLRPDIEVTVFRGSVGTRLRKLDEGHVDATLLAYAGLKRLAREEVATELLDPADFPPAPAQGAICIESRIGDQRIDSLLAPVNDHPTYDAVSCERSFLAALDGSCRTPIGGYAMCDCDDIRFSGIILTPDGQREHAIEAAIAGLGLPHAGLIVTSAEALRVLARPSVASRVDLDTPVYAVGEATAESARSLGFRRLHVGKGTGLELADLIVSIAPRDGRPLLYLAGRPRSRSLEDRLATSGREIRICEVYEMDAVDHDPADLAGLLGHPPADAVLLYSPDSAGRFFEVARPHAASLLATRFLCISRQAADRVTKEPVTLDLTAEEKAVVAEPVRAIDSDETPTETGSPAAGAPPADRATEEPQPEAPATAADEATFPRYDEAEPQSASEQEPTGYASATVGATPEFHQPEPKRSGPATSTLVASGIFGGLVALLLAGSMQYAGYLPGVAPSGAPANPGVSEELASLRQQIEALQTQQTPPADVVARLEALESKTPGESADQSAGRLAALETQLNDVKSATEATAANDADLARRLQQAETKINDRGPEQQAARAVAAAALKGAIDRGGPFEAELQTFEGVAGEDPAVATLKDFAAKGVPSRAELQRQVSSVADSMVEAASQPDPDQGVGARLLSSALSVVKVRKVGDVEGDAPDAIVARFEDRLRAGDFEAAVREWERLPEPAKSASRQFKQQLSARLQVENLVGGTLARAIAGTQE
eukprot:g18170.t1